MKKPEAIIRSMTLRERRNPNLLNASRRKRIAAGSGTTVQDVNSLMRQTAHALFGPDHPPSLYRDTLRRQGLMQVFYDYALGLKE